MKENKEFIPFLKFSLNVSSGKRGMNVFGQTKQTTVISMTPRTSLFKESSHWLGHGD